MPESPQSLHRTSDADSARIRPVTGRTILRLKSWGSGLAETCPKIRIAGLDLPKEVGAAGAGELRALCTGPSDWLMVAPGPLSLPTRDAVETDSAHLGLGVVDLSSGLSVFEIWGPASRQVLAKGCGLDLDPNQFTAGHCRRTRLAQMAVVIDTAPEPGAFDLYVARSQEHHLTEWLRDAAGFAGLPISETRWSG